MAWKFAPLQQFPDRYELALDNDCILWEMPQAVAEWLEDESASALIAEDVKTMLGQFSALALDAPRNSGIRGLSPGFDLEAALREVLREHPTTLHSELDEQGLQVAALYRAAKVHVVSVTDVSICSPFPPHLPSLGRAGAHFVGLNAKSLGFQLDGRPGELYTREHFDRHRDELYRRVGLPLPRTRLSHRELEPAVSTNRTG